MLHNRFGRQDHSKENRQAVIASPIVAKAVIRQTNGTYQIIVVFSQSTRLEFYWIFKVKSPRSSRRSWKYAGHEARDIPISGTTYTTYNAFVAFVAAHARRNAAILQSIRTPHKRRLSSLISKTAHESIYGNWEPQAPVVIKKDQSTRRMLSEGRRLAG